MLQNVTASPRLVAVREGIFTTSYENCSSSLVVYQHIADHRDRHLIEDSADSGAGALLRLLPALQADEVKVPAAIIQRASTIRRAEEPLL